MVAADVLRDDMPLIHWNAVDDGFLLDVRNPAELAVEYVPGALNIPLPELRARLGELPRDREILVFCRSGQRADYADAHPLAERVQSPQCRWRHVVTFASCGGIVVVEGKKCIMKPLNLRHRKEELP